jgi:Tol biopolymer transport system component
MPSWSPDGYRIGFLKGSGLWTIGADGMTARHISTARCTGQPPVWSWDNSHLLCVGPSLGLALPLFLYRVKADGSESINLTPQGVDLAVYSWSQDGARILYDDRAANYKDVFLMNADGSAARNLTSDPEGALQPFWTPAP